MKIWMVGIIGGVLVLGGVAAIAYKLHGTLIAPPPASVVCAETATNGDLVEIISAPGEVQPRTKVSISAKVPAPITELRYKEGDSVSRGSPDGKTPASILVKLDAKDLEAALRSAQARYDAQQAMISVSEQRIQASRSTIDSTRANMLDAERDLKRQAGLLSTSDVSQSVVDTAQTRFDSMRAQIASAEFSLKAEEANLIVEKHQLDAAAADVSKARDDLSYTVIASPIDGVVTRRKAEVGEMVVPGIQGSPGTTIMEVSDLSQMMMVARIDESSVTQVKPGQKARVRMQAFADEVFEGVVEWVANSRADATSSGGAAAASGDGSRYFECKIRLDTKGKSVLSGLSADADIEVLRHTGLKIPSQAVLGRPTDALPPAVRSKPEVDSSKAITTVVYRLINGAAVCTPVSVGPSDETHTLIKSGLGPSDQVIIGPYKELESLTDGQAVKAETVIPKAASRPTG